MTLPVIGLTLDWRQAGHYSKFPWYALRENYASAIADAGGIPLLLPFQPELVDAYLYRINGLVVTGGDFDVDPSLYGEKCQHERVVTIQNRTQFEYELVKKALARDMPVMGICGGHQLINVVLGGSLIQHIPDGWKDALAHEQPNPRNEPGHDIFVTPGTLLHTIVKTDMFAVNSGHHQAVKKVGQGVVVNSVAPDGIIEGIEHPGYKFCLGVQWHPEFILSPHDKYIFDAFIKAAA
jgi:putative glutamine amidotransferase